MSGARREILVCAAVAFAVGLVLVLLVPAGGDRSAHLYRTFLAREGVYVWDNLWYGGHYPFLAYSLLYYVPAALFGETATAMGSVVAAAALFASVSLREWGLAGRWPARVFAVLVTSPLVLGQYSYVAGVAALLLTLRLLQSGRRGLAVAAAALTLGFSPLTFVLLCVVLVAVAIARRPPSRRAAFVAGALAVLAGLEAALLSAFSVSGAYPFALSQLAALLAVCALAAALAAGSARGRTLAAFFAVWAAASVVVFVVPTPVGVNVTRPRWVVFALVLAAALVVRFRPRWLAATALAAAFAYGVVPYGGLIRDRLAAHSQERAFWAPAVEFLRRHAEPRYRVEVVATRAHWEAYYLPRDGIPLARGWYRQLDLAANGALYDERLSPARYRAWLRARGVKYVLLPSAAIERGGRAEARLLRSGRSGLRLVERSRTGSLYELPRPTPVLTGPRPAVVTSLDHDGVVGRVSAPGRYRLAIRYTPFWRVESGGVCVTEGAPGTTLLDAMRPGRFVLTVEHSPGRLLTAAVGGDEPTCADLAEE